MTGPKADSDASFVTIWISEKLASTPHSPVIPLLAKCVSEDVLDEAGFLRLLKATTPQVEGQATP